MTPEQLIHARKIAAISAPGNGIALLVEHIDAQAAEIEKLKADADRWSVIRAHWKQMKCTFRKSPNVVKRFVLTVDFDHQSGNDSTMIDREIDKAHQAQREAK